MRWDAVLLAAGAVADADPTLHAIYGVAVKVEGADGLEVPKLRLFLVSDVEQEQWEPVVIQWDQWTATMEDLVASERALVRLFTAEGTVTIAGVEMFTEYLDGESLATPDRDGFFGRAVRFRCTPLRELYVAQGH